MNPYEPPQEEAVWAEVLEDKKQMRPFVPYAWWAAAIIFSMSLSLVNKELSETAYGISFGVGLLVCIVIEARNLAVSYGRPRGE